MVILTLITQPVKPHLYMCHRQWKEQHRFGDIAFMTERVRLYKDTRRGRVCVSYVPLRPFFLMKHAHYMQEAYVDLPTKTLEVRPSTCETLSPRLTTTFVAAVQNGCDARSPLYNQDG